MCSFPFSTIRATPFYLNVRTEPRPFQGLFQEGGSIIPWLLDESDFLKVLFLNVVSFELHTIRPTCFQFFDPFQVIRFVEFLRIGVCLNDISSLGAKALLPAISPVFGNR